MSHRSGRGSCEDCGGDFPYYIVHNGFGDSAYAYCEACGRTALLDGWKMPSGLGIAVHRPVSPEREDRLLPCPCGSRFRGNASPRCPECRGELSPVAAAAWIERDAPGTRVGWRWQRSWQGTYAIVIADRIVRDPWRVPDGGGWECP